MIYTKSNHYELHLGKMQDVLEELPPESVDAIVTDPPYELGFMGKSWDSSGVAFSKDTWEHCLRVLKPGGYLLAFGGTRTFHRIACVIEDAGFEIRDTIMWLYGSGFPKSLNIGLAIDKKNGVESEVIGRAKGAGSTGDNDAGNQTFVSKNQYEDGTYDIKKAQNKWSGWGTCLKPAYEPVIVARKPFTGSLVDNVLEYGVGGINIDECRVGNDYIDGGTMPKMGAGDTGVCNFQTVGAERVDYEGHFGRFPANVMLTYDDTDEKEVCGGMPYTKSGSEVSYGCVRKQQVDNCYKLGFTQKEINDGQYAPDSYGDEGNASRYFYCAKASKRDRDEGLDAFEEKKVYGDDVNWGYGNNNGDNFGDRVANVSRRNVHPTVKPVALMQYLVRLVAPKGSVVLDPFNGSGSTGKACMYENNDRCANYYYIGVEMTEEYLPISKARIDYAISDTDRLEYEVIPNETDTSQSKKQTKIYLW